MQTAVDSAPSHKLTGLLRKPIVSLVSKLPVRSKRLIFMASLMGVLQQVKNPDMVLVHKLNDVLHIAKDPDAMVFPMYIKSVIWKDISAETIVMSGHIHLKISEVLQRQTDTETYRDVAQYFTERAPKWLQYSDPSTMIKETVEMMQLIRSYQFA